MKKLYLYLGILAFFLVFKSAQAQVVIQEDFDDGLPDTWNTLGFIASTSEACDGGAVRRHFKSDGAQSGFLSSPFQTTTGEDIEVTFDYKVIDDATGNPATTGDFGTMDIQYSIDGGTTWTTYYTIDENSTNSASCTTRTDVLSATDIPADSDFAWKIDGTWNEGDYYVYIDNFSIIEQVDCLQPYNLSVSDMTNDSAEIDWEDLPGSSATSWTITYVVSGLPPGSPLANEVTATTNPYDLTGLTEGTKYDVYITADCDTDGESALVGPVTFNTVAIGADCENAKEVTALPYNDAGQNTADYGNNYAGAAGVNCGASGNFLDGFDVVYEYTPTEDDILQIDLSDISENYSGIFVYDSCDDIGDENAACLGASTNEESGDHGVEDLFVTGGVTYYVVISSFPTGSGGVIDSFEYTLDITGFDCASFVAPTGDASQLYVDGQQLLDFDVAPTINGASLTWYSDAALTTEIPETTLIVDGTTYYVAQTVGNCESADALAVTAEEFDCAAELEVTSTTEGDGACDSGSILLSAEGATDEPKNLYWFNDPVEGDIVNVGADFQTPELDETTSYWVAEAFLGEGPTYNQGNPGPTSNSSIAGDDTGLTFEITEKITLSDVEVYNTGAAGALVLTITGSDDLGDIAPIVITQSISGGTSGSPKASTIVIDAELNPGTYTIVKISGPGLLYKSTETKFPYAIGTSGSIINGKASYGTNSSYYYFFNWSIIEFKPLCESERVEVEANVYPIIPIDSVVPEDNEVCSGSSTNITASSTNDDYTYSWMPGSLTGETVTVSPTENTTYTVTATDAVTGCETESEVTIEVVETPGELTMAPFEASVCAGESVELMAGGIAQNFEDDNNWTVVSNSSGSEADFEVQDSPYLSAGITSNDNSKFYFASSAMLGADGEVDVELISPSFSLVSVTEASVRFYHQYRHHPSTQADVDITTDDGTTWETLASYTSSQGKASNFDYESVKIGSEYLNKQNVKIRFHYTGGWGWWWAIDNVTIGRKFHGNVTWSSDDGLANLFMDRAGTISYTEGTNTQKVFFSTDDETSQTFTATLEVDECGNSVSGDVTVSSTVVEDPIAETDQELVEGAVISDLEVEGENLVYYEDEDAFVQIKKVDETELIDGVTYYVTQNQNGCESSPVAITVTLFSPSQSCAAPTTLNIEDTAADSVTITWEEPENTNGIENYYYTVTDSEENIVYQGEILIGTHMINLTDLDDDSSYTFTLYSVCDAENEVYSDDPESIVLTTLATENVEFINLTYYPNPTADRVMFKNQLSIDRIEVYNLLGQKVFQSKPNTLTTSIDFSGFSSGVYLTKITSGNATKIVRIIRE